MRKVFLGVFLIFVLSSCQSTKKSISMVKSDIEYNGGLKVLEKFVVSETSNLGNFKVDKTQFFFFKLTISKANQVEKIVEINNQNDENAIKLIETIKKTSSSWINNTNESQNIILPILLVKDIENSIPSKPANPLIGRSPEYQIMKAYFLTPIVIYFYHDR